ncbi:MAG: hypothetical protein KAI47_05690, partial [Deltaproteobacteria bacterium]|nr:hypothetical protein [Deltaproteobacteria bacterium]
SFAEALHAPNQSAGAPPSNVPQPLDTIIEALRSGAMDGNGAAQKMIDRVVASRGEHLSPEMQQQLRDTLERALGEDPMLATKLRKLDEAAEAER